MLLVISIFKIQKNVYGKYQKLIYVSLAINIHCLGIDKLGIQDLC